MAEDYNLEMLANGMPLTYRFVAGVPDIAFSIIFTVGHYNVDAGLEQAAHFIEHMLFKPTQAHPTHIPTLLQELSGREIGGADAITAPDFLIINYRIPNVNQRDFFELFFDLVNDTKLDPAEVEKERTVILNELADSKTDRGRFNRRAVELMLPGYMRAVSLYDAAQSLDAASLVNFKMDAISASNAAIFLVGAVDDDTLSIVRNHFQGLRKGKKFPRISPSQKPAYSLMASDFEGEYSMAYSLSWQAPSRENPDSAFLSVLLRYLAHGLSSRLGKRLRDERSLVYGIGQEYTYFISTAVAEISVTNFSPESFPEISAVIAEEIESAKNGEFDKTHLERIRKGNRFTFFQNYQETIEDYRNSIMHQLIAGRASNREYLQLLAGFDAGDLARVAQTYLTQERIDLIRAPKGQLPSGIERTVIV